MTSGTKTQAAHAPAITQPRQQQQSQQSVLKPRRQGRDWLLFDGTCELVGDDALLTPRLDPTMRIYFAASEVEVRDHGSSGVTVHVLRDAQYKSVDIPPTSVLNTTAARNESNLSCGGPTYCLGGIRFCCGDSAAIGQCNGHWPCPVKQPFGF
jgi:hypothetical protein